MPVFGISIGVQRSTGPAFVSLIALWGPLTWLPLAGAFAVTGAVYAAAGGSAVATPASVTAQPGGEPPAGGRHPNPSLPASPSA